MSAPLGPGAPDENDASTQATPASADPLQLNGPELEPEEMAALAAVLMLTAVRMVPAREIRTILRSTRSDAFVLLLTKIGRAHV